MVYIEKDESQQNNVFSRRCSCENFSVQTETKTKHFICFSADCEFNPLTSMKHSAEATCDKTSSLEQIEAIPRPLSGFYCFLADRQSQGANKWAAV